MAIYHYSSQVIGRSGNKNAVAAAAYRSGSNLTAKIVDRETGISVNKNFDYSNKQNVAYSKIMAPENSPKWVQDRNKLWNAVERVEKRKDAQLAREVNIALPKELTLEQNKELIEGYVQKCFVSKGMVADYSIHWEENNPHVHIMTTMRDLHKHGFGQKNRNWNSKYELVASRAMWAEHTNEFLKKNNIDSKIDHRSYKEQGVNLLSTIHEGVEKVGSIWKDRVDENEKIRSENLERIKKDPTILLKKVSMNNITFSKEDIAKEVFNMSMGDEKSFQEIYDKVIYSKSIAMVTSSDVRGRERYVLNESKELENKLWANVEKLSNNDSNLSVGKFFQGRSLGLTGRKLDEFTELSKGLSPEQSKAVENITSNGNLSILIGRAGTGKTTTLSAVADYYNLLGRNVKGGAISGIASDGLAGDKNNIDSRTIAKWIKDFKEGNESLGENDVFIIDEASMVDTKSLEKIVSVVSDASAKLILVGDNLQLQPIGGGSPFRGILEKLDNKDLSNNISTLSQVWRQREGWQADLSTKIAERDIQTSITEYSDQGRLNWSSNGDEALINLSQDYVKEYINGDSKNLLALTYTDNASRELNLLIRDGLKDAGILKNEQEYLTKNGYLDVAVGDKLLFLENSKALGVKNGQAAEVVEIGNNNIKVKFGDDSKSKHLSFNIKDYNNISHAYSVTTHKSQGQSVDKSFVYVESNHNFNSLYVAMTRHKQDMSIYANKESHRDLGHLVYSATREDYKDLLSDFSIEKDSEKLVVKDYLESVEDCKLYYSELSDWSDKENKSFTEHKKWGKYLSSLKHRENIAKQLCSDKKLFRPIIMQAGLSYSAIENHAGIKAKTLQSSRSSEQQRYSELVQEYSKDKNSELGYVISKDIPNYGRYFKEHGITSKDIKASKDDFINASCQIKDLHNMTLTAKLASLEGSISTKKNKEQILESVMLVNNQVSSLENNIAKNAENIQSKITEMAHLSYKNEIYSHNKSGDNVIKHIDLIDKNKLSIERLDKAQNSLSDKQSHLQEELQSEKSKLGYLSNSPKALERALKDADKAQERLIKNPEQSIDSKTNETRERSKDRIDITRSIDAKELHEKFVRNPSNISSLSQHVLGSCNKQLSSARELRFGKSGKLIVNLTGDKAGLWYDFSRDTGGNMYTLLREERGLDLKESKEYLGNIVGEYGLERNFVSVEAKAINKSEIKDIQESKDNSVKLEELDKNYGFDIKKQEQVEKVIKSTEKIGNSIAKDYLQNHRKIDISKINLSDDVRFSKEFHSSEDKKNYPALVVIARNTKGEARATQSIYLDKETSNKNESLNIKKRSMGNLKGSFVELTNNKDSDIIYIAEGVETGLSIANASPDARVICALGISNIKNIDLQSESLYGKAIVICADNDDKNHDKTQNNQENISQKQKSKIKQSISTKETIEKAAVQIKESHNVKYVSVITPLKSGQDFNDVLKSEGLKSLKEYTIPFDAKLDVRYNDLQHALKHNGNINYGLVKELQGVYKDTSQVLSVWKELVDTKGLDQAEILVKENPAMLGEIKGSNILGIKNNIRKAAEEHKGIMWESLSEYTRIDKVQQNIEKEIVKLEDKYLKPLYEFNPSNMSNMNQTAITKEYESLISKASALDSNKRSIIHIKSLATKITDHIIHSDKVHKNDSGSLSFKDRSAIINKHFKDHESKIISSSNYDSLSKEQSIESRSSKNLSLEKTVEDRNISKEQEIEKTKDER